MNCAAVSGVPSQRHRVPSQTSSTYVKANEFSVAPTLFINIDADTSGLSEICMQRIPKAIYQTPKQLTERIKAREAQATELPSGEDRQEALKEIAQLRMYLDAKLWIGSPGLKPGR
jgi:hypothetical protein